MANDANRLLLNHLIPMDATIAAVQRQIQTLQERLLAMERQLADTRSTDQIATLKSRLEAIEEHLAASHRRVHGAKPELRATHVENER